MEVDLILKVAGICLIIAVVCQVLSKVGKDEQSNMVSLVGIVIILALVAERVVGLVNSIKDAFGL